MRILTNGKNVNKKGKHGNSNKQISRQESGCIGSDSKPYEEKERTRGGI
jgi:hypothetical protein